MYSSSNVSASKGNRAAPIEQLSLCVLFSSAYILPNFFLTVSHFSRRPVHAFS